LPSFKQEKNEGKKRTRENLRYFAMVRKRTEKKEDDVLAFSKIRRKDEGRVKL